MSEAMETKQLILDDVDVIEVKDGTRGEISGYAAVYGNVDGVADIAHPGCAAKSIQERGIGLPVCWEHDIKGVPFGTTLEAKEVDRDAMPVWLQRKFPDAVGALYVRGQGVMTAQNAGRLREVKSGRVRGLSIGYIPMTYDFSVENGRRVRNLREIKLIEWSLVSRPANQAAVATEIKSDQAVFGEMVSDLVAEYKVGRMISAANLARLQAWLDSLGVTLDEMRELIAAASPVQGDMPDDPSEKSGAAPQVDIDNRLREAFARRIRASAVFGG